MSSKPPRRVALQLLRDWESGSGFAADLIAQAAGKEGLSARDRAFVQRLLFATIRNLGLVDHFLKELATGKLDPKTRRVLRLGLTEALFLENSPHALVNECVKMAGWAKGIVNAILRRALQEKDALLASAEALPPFIRWSIPEFLWKRWVREFGPENAEFLARWNKDASPIFLRPNPWHPDPLDLTALDLTPVPDFPGFFQVQGEFLPEWVQSGRAYAQDPSTSAAITLLEAEAGHQILDACAAPGGKSFAIACAMPAEARIYAADRSPDRLETMERNFGNLRISNRTTCFTRDWLDPDAAWPEGLPKTFDRILIDVPCSNTGVIRRRIDVPWRLSKQDFRELPETQYQILTNLAPRLSGQGRLVYSTCSLDHAENEAVIDRFLSAHPEFKLAASKRVLPWEQGVDGAYAAALIRTG